MSGRNKDQGLRECGRGEEKKSAQEGSPSLCSQRPRKSKDEERIDKMKAEKDQEVKPRMVTKQARFQEEKIEKKRMTPAINIGSLSGSKIRTDFPSRL
jgi:hypothetical protein